MSATPAERCALLAEAVRCPGAAIQLPDNVSEGVGGRVIFGTDESAFAYLSGEGQSYPFIVGADDLVGFCAKATHMEMMDAIGFEKDWVNQKLQEGNEFRLVLFPSTAFEDGLISPTWDNLLLLVQRESAQAAQKLAAHLEELKSASYTELCSKIGYDMDNIPLEVYDNVKSFHAYADDAVPNDVAHARAFLRATLKCTPLFSGDGFATNEHGERGVREYLVKRTAIATLPGAQWVALDPSQA